MNDSTPLKIIKEFLIEEGKYLSREGKAMEARCEGDTWQNFLIVNSLTCLVNLLVEISNFANNEEYVQAWERVVMYQKGKGLYQESVKMLENT